MSGHPAIRTVRLSWSLIKGYRLLSGFNTALWFGYFLVPIATGLLQRAVFDRLAGTHPSQTAVWELVALMVAVTTAGYLVTYPRVLLDNQIQFGIAARLRANLLEHLLGHPGASLPSSPGDAVSRFRDDVGMVTGFLWLPMLVTGGLGFGLVAFVIMIRINALITLAVLVPIVGVVVGTQVLTSRLQRYRRASREATGRVTGFLGEILGAVQATKVAGAESSLLRRLDELNAHRASTAVRDQMFSQALIGLYSNTTQLGTGIMLLLAANAMRTHTFTVGDFALFVSYLEWLTAIPLYLGRLLSDAATTAVSFDRMAALMPGARPDAVVRDEPIRLDREYPPIASLKKGPADRFERLEVAGLTYRYPGTSSGIQDIHFRMARGELVVIVGRVGSGKTTLLRVLLGLLPADSGDVWWNGHRVRDLAAFMLPPRVAYTSQVPRLFSGTLRHNILLGLPVDPIQAETAVRLAGLELDIAVMSEGLDTEVGRRGIQLSGGQVQRAAAARMLVREPELLVVDDLSSALDIETERALWQRLLAGHSRTVLAASHRQLTLEQANRIIVLRNGHIDAVGTLPQVLAGSEEARRIWQGGDVHPY